MDNNFTVLNTQQLAGNFKNRLNIIDDYGRKAEVSDFAILLGASQNYLHQSYSEYGVLDISKSNVEVIRCDYDGDLLYDDISCLNKIGTRPIIEYSKIASKTQIKKFKYKWNEIDYVEYGEYPQTVVDNDLRIELEKAQIRGRVIPTGKCYTALDSKYIEYIYKETKYICLIATDSIYDRYSISRNRVIFPKDKCWIKVEPIAWLVDHKFDMAVSKGILFAGIPYFHKNDSRDIVDLNNSNIIKYLNTCFANDIIPSLMSDELEVEKPKQKIKK